MRFNQDVSLSSYSIRGYQPGQIHVIFPFRGSPSAERNSAGPHQETLTSSFILSPETLIRNWAPRSVQALQAIDFGPIKALEPEVVLLGTGQTLDFPDIAITAELMARGIGVEVMDTPAACRTYNILMHEGRKVVAAVIQ